MQLIAGTDKHLSSVTQVMLTGGSFTRAQVTRQLQALVKLRDDVDAAKASTKARLALEKAEAPALRTLHGCVGDVREGRLQDHAGRARGFRIASGDARLCA